MLLLLALVNSPSAQQTNPRLETLFAELQTQNDADRIEALEREIWAIWNDSGRADVNAGMAEARQALMMQGLIAALGVYDRVISMAPNFAEAWNRRATMHYMNGDYKASMKDIEKTLALEPRHYGAIFGKALIHTERGDFAAARAAFDEVRKVHPHAQGVDGALERLRSLEAE